MRMEVCVIMSRPEECAIILEHCPILPALKWCVFFFFQVQPSHSRHRTGVGHPRYSGRVFVCVCGVGFLSINGHVRVH